MHLLPLLAPLQLPLCLGMLAARPPELATAGNCETTVKSLPGDHHLQQQVGCQCQRNLKGVQFAGDAFTCVMSRLS